MKDIDQTNIYSYKGEDYCMALKEYLSSNGLEADEIEVEGGYIIIRFNGLSIYKFPQFAQWKWIEEKIRQWMK